jgi:D-glycero-D-manno-heptose 1,7-bisphosphate phosphatase
VKDPLIFSLRPLVSENTLFLDRDGVLNHAVMRGSEISSPRSLNEFRIAEDIDALATPEIVRYWNLVIVSNQPDISRGRIDIEFLKEIHKMLNRRIPLNEVYICPHQQLDGCLCRKPGIGLIQLFRHNHPNLKGKECMVGDRICDRDCAIKAGISFVLRKRPYISEYPTALSVNTIDDLWSLKTQLII